MKIHNVAIIGLAVSFLVVCETVVASRLYKWLDDKGQVHYTDRPPTGIKAEERTIRSSPGIAGNSAAGGLRAGESELLRKAADRKSAIKRSRREFAREYELKQAGCGRARKRYHEEIRKPGSEGGDHKARARDYYEDMRDACG